MDVYATLYEKKWFQGMEVCNSDEYYPQAHKWCMEKNLTVLGGSDSHKPDLRERTTPGNHRTMTLVFAKERTVAGLKDALLQGRTVVWCKDQLIGRKEWLGPLFDASVRIGPPRHPRWDTVWAVEIRNLCDVDFQLESAGSQGPPRLVLPAQSTTLVTIGATVPTEPVALSYTVKNLLVAPKTGLSVILLASKAE